MRHPVDRHRGDEIVPGSKCLAEAGGGGFGKEGLSSAGSRLPTSIEISSPGHRSRDLRSLAPSLPPHPLSQQARGSPEELRIDNMPASRHNTNQRSLKNTQPRTKANPSGHSFSADFGFMRSSSADCLISSVYTLHQSSTILVGSRAELMTHA